MFQKNIILVGFMGSGKTLVGQELTRKTGMKFVDLDTEIEHHEGCPISEIFDQKGELYFRDVESMLAKKYSRKRNQVISTGGGVVKSEQNMKHLQKNGVLFFLDSSVDEIWENTRSTAHRPLLKVPNPKERIRQLLEERIPQYRKSDFIVKTKNRDAPTIAKEIMSIYKKRKELSRLNVCLEEHNSYDIVIGNDIRDLLACEIRKVFQGTSIHIITNTTVNKLYGSPIEIHLKEYGFDVHRIVIPDGERYKTQKTLGNIYDKFIENRLHRDGLVLTLGGGVVGDIGGYAAATYMRGISYIHIPTTLLADVDSSVGGKVGINHPKGKNMIGAFFQPKLVFIDTAFLKSLNKMELRAGLAEVIKYGIIHDARLFKYLQKNRKKIINLNHEAVNFIVKKSCEIKTAVVEKDEKEEGLRAILNFGHTFGHAIEAVTRYKTFRHGEAIAIGMNMAAALSVREGYMKREEMLKITKLIRDYKLPIKVDQKKASPENIFKAMKKDKKVFTNRLRFILAQKIGKVFISNDIAEEDIKPFLLDPRA
ncbi:3-dehydroquinate synthase [PVC group bacterium]|nr:3-dehydroquinate synthase [PVC group bacterium]